MLAPHDTENAELSDIGRPSEDVFDLLVFGGSDPVLLDDVGCYLERLGGHVLYICVIASEAKQSRFKTEIASSLRSSQ